MGGSYVSKVKVYKQNDKLIKQIEKSDNTVMKKAVNFIDLDKAPDDFLKGFETLNQIKDIDFCILDDIPNMLNLCAYLFKENDNYISNLDRYAITNNGEKCVGYVYRSGSMFPKNEEQNAKTVFGDLVRDGRKCQLVFQDYNYNDQDMVNCCLGKVPASSCNKNLVNDFKTTHCDEIMKRECLKDMESVPCVRWLEQSITRSNDEALRFYMEFCKKNHFNKSCSYFCKVSRQMGDYRSYYCDNSLNAWCLANKPNKNCHCVVNTLQQKQTIDEIETFLGPKECWLSECASQEDPKWLTTQQLKTRTTCSAVTCIINIDSLTLEENATISFVNNCSNIGSFALKKTQDIPRANTKKDTINTTLSPGVLLSVVSIFALLLTH